MQVVMYVRLSLNTRVFVTQARCMWRDEIKRKRCVVASPPGHKGEPPPSTEALFHG